VRAGRAGYLGPMSNPKRDRVLVRIGTYGPGRVFVPNPRAKVLVMPRRPRGKRMRKPGRVIKFHVPIK
jgi:hypothetical protein